MTKKELTLALLESAGAKGVDSRQFTDAGIYRYSARIQELRHEGYEIETHRIGNGHFNYKLLPPEKAGPDSPGATAGQSLLSEQGESQQTTDSPEGKGESPSGDPLPLFDVPAPAPYEGPGHIDPDQRGAA